MLISKVADDAGGEEGRAAMECLDTNPEYRTASDLFELMTKDTHFDANDDDSLTTQDLVLLYKNIDIGTKLMNEATVVKLKKPNQYVETVVYNDEPESGSETSEIYNADDIQNVFLANQERLDFLNDKSLQNLLCHKLGGLEIKTSEIPMEYERNLIFKDPCITRQLKHLNVTTSSSECDTLLSTSLLDYICCKRLEDNYNFYMDNIIKYVQHTIEQLKRISNGDYLTDRAKEKWSEVNSEQQQNNTKVLATSTSIPLHVECKGTGNVTWDDIVHSEVDVRSLSKILEKKIVVEIPKLICGSYRLYSKRCADNLIISCQREIEKTKQKDESRVDVVLQLQRSQTGQVMSKISSIMILRSSPSADIHAKEILPVPYKEAIDLSSLINKENLDEPTVTVIELNKDTNFNTNVAVTELELKDQFVVETLKQQIEEYQESQNDNSIVTNDYPFSDQNASCDNASKPYSSETSLIVKDSYKPIFSLSNNEAFYNGISDELRTTMRRLNMQTMVLDETVEQVTSQTITKRRSPVRVRIKSPYENKSFLLEEKKRKRLLEIRDRREKKKMALSETCKITKHRYAKGAIMPQASSSVTKLSITNKSFYNSIYGQSLNVEKLPKARKIHKNNIFTVAKSCTEQFQMGEYFESPMLTPEKNSKKYINRSYYLDDAETEMMYMQMKQNENVDVQNPCSASNSVVSNEITDNLNLLQHLMEPPETNFNVKQTYLADHNPQILDGDSYSEEEPLFTCPIVDTAVQNLVPTNSTDDLRLPSKKVSSSYECRKSIDKLYELIKKFGKPNAPADLSTTKSKARTNLEASEGIGGQSTIQGSDSGTSVKHHVTSSSFHSSFSSERNNIEVVSKSSKNQPSVLPKVIISSKLQSPKIETTDKMKKDRRKAVLSGPSKTVPDNPLKAISQLMHEFDNVQKIRQKPTLETRLPKKIESVSNDVKNSYRQGSYNTRRSRLEQHLKENDQEKKNVPTHYHLHHTTKEKKARPVPTEISRNIHQQNLVEDKNFDKFAKKKIADIIDEAKEARGEAVRGPSKFYSRLNSLAQPKKSYVQAHHVEYSTRYGRNMLAERLQKLASAVVAPSTERNVVSPTPKNRLSRMTAASMKQPACSVPHLDKGAKFTRLRRSASSSSSPNRPVPITYKHSLPDAPEAISKMAAVETYVKSHYGPCSEVLLAGHKSRVPHVPQDLDLASISSTPTVQESFELGNKLHHMIDCMLTNASPLTALTEYPESNAKPSNSDLSEKAFSREARTDSEFYLDILEDNNLETAVETIDIKKDNNLCTRSSKHDLQPLNSTTELEKLENALYNQISGTFQKRLRIKNLTLTPKCSMQQVFFIQTGDAGPLRVKSTVSNLKINKCSAESLHDLKVMSVLSSSHLDWTFTQIPMQIATVGYAFPEYQASRNTLNTTVKLLEVPSENEAQKHSQSDKITQCFKEIFQKTMTDSGDQVDIGQEIVAVSVESLTSHATNSQMLVEIEKIETTKKLLLPNNIATVDILKCTGDNNKAVKNVTNAAIQEIQEEIIKESSENSKPMSISDAIDNTTSLDMLVGLLNEIQKITCQNQMAAADNDQNCADLENILYNAAALEKVDFNTSRNVVSMSSLDNLRQLESETSIYSFYISSDDESANNVEPVVENKVTQYTEIYDDSNNAQSFSNNYVNKESSNRNMATDIWKPAGVDKEVSANITCKTNVDTFTEMPSLMPITINHSTNVTNSTVGVISKPSTQSILSFTDYQTVYSNTLFRTHPSIKKLLELPHVELNEQLALMYRGKSGLNENFLKTNLSSIHSCKEIKNDRSLIARSELSKYCVKNIDLDPMFKIKRDMLLTMYSILVLTVFAALSFPELIMFQYY